MAPEADAGDGSKREFPCEQCGASLHYQPGADHLTCPYCAHTQAIPQAPRARIVEHDFHEGLRAMARRPASQVAQGKSVRCSGCGAVQTVHDQSTRCAFCDSPVVVEEDDPQVIVPESVLPFALDQRNATEHFRQWLASRWFAPSDLTTRARKEGMDGVYLPYWTYDADTTTDYRGERGDETETYYEDGERKTRQVRKTRWSRRRGTVFNRFDDVLVCASRSLPSRLVDALEPWDLGGLRPYEPGYLSGFRTERYAVELAEGFEVAKGRMEPEIRRTVRGDIGGDEQRIHHMDIAYHHVRFKHFLLPLWISSFRYDDKVYRVIVNARTGEVAGERPWSVLKILAAVLGTIALIILVVLILKWTRKPEPPPDGREPPIRREAVAP